MRNQCPTLFWCGPIKNGLMMYSVYRGYLSVYSRYVCIYLLFLITVVFPSTFFSLSASHYLLFFLSFFLFLSLSRKECSPQPTGYRMWSSITPCWLARRGRSLKGCVQHRGGVYGSSRTVVAWCAPCLPGSWCSMPHSW